VPEVEVAARFATLDLRGRLAPWPQADVLKGRLTQ